MTGLAGRLLREVKGGQHPSVVALLSITHEHALSVVFGTSLQLRVSPLPAPALSQTVWLMGEGGKGGANAGVCGKRLKRHSALTGYFVGRCLISGIMDAPC